MGRKTRQNKITSPELIAQINPKNIRLMNDFLEYLRSIGKADSTVKAYTSDLYIFFVWVLQMRTTSISRRLASVTSSRTKTGCCGTTRTLPPVCAG